MKKYLFIYLFIASLVLLNACQRQSEVIVQEENVEYSTAVKSAFSVMEKAVSANRNLVGSFIVNSLTKGGNSDDAIAYADELCSGLYSESLFLLEALEFNKEDVYELFGENREIDQLSDYDICGLALFSYSLIKRNGIENIQTKSDVVDCFLEATGIAAGVAVVGALSGQMIGKAAVKTVLKAVAKIGGKTLGGIGLALMAAEFTWCMLSD